MNKEKNIPKQFTTEEIIRVIKKIKIRGTFRCLDVLSYQIDKVENYTEAEQKIENLVLGCILQNETISIALLEFFFVERHFNKPENEYIYKCIMALFGSNIETTKNNLLSELKHRDELELVGGESYIEQLTTNTLSEENKRNLSILLRNDHILTMKV